MIDIFSFREATVFSSTFVLVAALSACGGEDPATVGQLAATNPAVNARAGDDAVLLATSGYVGGSKKNSRDTRGGTTTSTSTSTSAGAPIVGSTIVPAANVATVSVTSPTAYLTADPVLPYASIDAANLQYMGTNVSPSGINESTGVPGNAVDGLTNFMKVADPDDPTKNAFMFQIAKRDPGSAKRTELAWPSDTKGYSLGVTYWQAFRVRLGDNIKYAPATDESIIWQVHDNSGTEDLNPNMALIAKGGGANAALVVSLKYSSSSIPSVKANAIGRIVYNATGYPSNKWITFVVQFRPHHTVQNGAFFKMWRDGQLVVDDTLPNDYNVGQDIDPSKRSYQKIGLYHYYDDQWVVGESRTIHHRGVITYVDNQAITESFMRNLIEAR